MNEDIRDTPPANDLLIDSACDEIMELEKHGGRNLRTYLLRSLISRIFVLRDGPQSSSEALNVIADLMKKFSITSVRVSERTVDVEMAPTVACGGATMSVIAEDVSPHGCNHASDAFAYHAAGERLQSKAPTVDVGGESDALAFKDGELFAVQGRLSDAAFLDECAMRAMQRLTRDFGSSVLLSDETARDMVAATSYRVADAMLAERKRRMT